MFTFRLPVRTTLALVIMALCAGVVLVERTGLLPAAALPAGLLLEWAVILGGVALLLGVFNVLWVHLRRIQRGQAGWSGSLLLVVTLIAVVVAGLSTSAGDRAPLMEWTYDALIVPGAATLFALAIFFLTAAIFHHVRVGRPGGAWVLLGLVLVVVAQTPAARALLAPESQAWVEWLIDAPVTATVRGLLLGTALGLLVVSLRLVARRRS
jgi:hypothetical protein